MKRKTMAIFAVAAFVILSAVLIQAVDTDARAGDSEDEPKYIIGGVTQNQQQQPVKVYETLGTGLEAKISYNSLAFYNQTVTFNIKGDGDYQTLTLSSDDPNDPKTGSVVVQDWNIMVTITEDKNRSGVYTVQFKPGDTTVEGTILIKMTVKQAHESLEVSQDFYYAANISATSSIGKIVVGNNSADGTLYDQSDDPNGENIPTLTFQYDTDVSMLLTTKEYVNDAWTLRGGYSYYGTGLPDGISITLDGRIGGKLSSDVDSSANDNLTIFAVKNGLTSKLTIPWNVGEKPMYNADFKLTVDGIEQTKVIKKLGDDQTTIVKAEGSGGWTVNSYEVDVDPSSVTDDPGGKKIAAYTATGTHIVTVTAKMTKNGMSMTVEKTFTVYVVGGIYDGNLKPVVKTA